LPQYGLSPDFVEDVVAVGGRERDQSSLIDPAVDRPAGGTRVEEQVMAVQRADMAVDVNEVW